MRRRVKTVVQYIIQAELRIDKIKVKLEGKLPAAKKEELREAIDDERREIVNRIISLNLNQEKIKRLVNKIKNLGHKVREYEDEIHRYEKRFKLPYTELKKLYHKALAKQMPSGQFQKLTGYTTTGIESTMQNIETIQLRLVRMARMLPVTPQELLSLDHRIRELEEERRRRMDERAFWERAIEAQQRANAANFEAVSGLVDRVVQAQAAIGGASQSSGRDEWLLKKLERVEERDERRAEELRELSIKHARRHASGDESDGWWGLLEKGAPMALSAWTEFKELQEKKLKLEEERLKRRRALPEGGIVVKGVPLPSLDKLRAKLESEPLPDEMRVLFRGMIRDGMLPRAYEELLTPYLRETDRESGETPG
jgi:chromosome segregation ATPase